MDGSVTKAAQLWARYTVAADRLELQARVDPARHGAALCKAVVYRDNANQLYRWLHERNLVKGYPIPKKFKWKGMDVSIESPAGSVRQWYDPFERKNGLTLMLNDYGYLRGTNGVDGDKIDVYFGPDPEGASLVYVVRQLKGPDFRYYDEDKCMIGFDSAESARLAYIAHYNNPRFLGALDVFPVDSFLNAVRATKRAPAPVGGWLHLGVQRRVSDLKEALPSAVLDMVDDTNLDTPAPCSKPRPAEPQLFQVSPSTPGGLPVECSLLTP